MRKIIFFDIDGTLVDFSGKMPESTVASLKAARKNGHKLFICTGRSISQLPEELGAFAFDGYVAAAGAYVECEGQEIFHHHMPVEDVKKALDFFHRENAVYSAQTKDETLMEPESRVRFIKIIQQSRDMPVEEIEKNILARQGCTPIMEKINQIEKFCYHECQCPVGKVRQILGDHFDVTRMSFERPNDFSGEITCRGVHKASGMQKVLDYYHAVREDSVAFGDGPNDLEMIEFAGTGVAMGNAIPELKEKADMVTSSVLEDGIQKAMIELELF